MQHIAKQDRVETLVSYRKVAAIVWKVIDMRSGAGAHIQSNHSRSQHALKMVCDEAVAAANVEDVGASRKHACDFERHVVCSCDFPSSSNAFEATFDGCA